MGMFGAWVLICTLAASLGVLVWACTAEDTVATAGDIVVRLVLVDRVSRPSRRLAWKFLTFDGQWHVEFMRADGLRPGEAPMSKKPVGPRRRPRLGSGASGARAVGSAVGHDLAKAVKDR